MHPKLLGSSLGLGSLGGLLDGSLLDLLGSLLRRGGLLGGLLHAGLGHELDDAHLGVVALTGAEAHDAGVTAVAVGPHALSGLLEDLLDELLVAELGDSKTTGVQVAALGPRDDGLGKTTERLGARNGGLDTVVGEERLGQALDKVQARVKPQPQSHSSVERIPVVKSGRKVLVPIDQIRYIEAKDDYSCIYTADDRFLSTTSLAKLEQKLAPHGFFRVHRGYIVNLEYVEDVEVISSGILQLGVNGIEGKKISVSRRRVVALKRALGL